MKKAIERFDRFLGKIEFSLVMFAGVLVVFMMLYVTAAVIFRYFSMPLPATVELVQLVFIAVVFLSIPYVQGIRGHINIEIGSEKMSDGLKRSLDFLGYFLAIFIVAIMAWQTGLQFWSSYLSSDYTPGMIEYRTWPSKFAITLGMVLLEIRLIFQLVTEIFYPEFMKSNEDIENEDIAV